MFADCKGALDQIDQSYKSFTHKGNSMSKKEVEIILKYSIAQGYENTGQITDDEVDFILNQLRSPHPNIIWASLECYNAADLRRMTLDKYNSENN